MDIYLYKYYTMVYEKKLPILIFFRSVMNDIF